MPDNFCPQCGERLEPNARFCTACGTEVSVRAQGTAPPSERKARRSPPWLLLIVLAGAALFLAGLLLSQPEPEPVGVAGAPQEEADTQEGGMVETQEAADLPYPEVPRISVEETRERLVNGAALVVDVRSARNYADAHVTDALSLPVSELQDRYQELPSDAEIITYCT